GAAAGQGAGEAGERRRAKGPQRRGVVGAGGRPPAADRAHRNGRAKGRGKGRRMTPTDPRLLVHAYLDGELDPAHALEIERQLADDPALAAERERVEALRRAIAEQLPREGAPPGLAHRIEAALGLRPAPALARSSSRPSWRALAASVAVAAFLGSSATWLALSPGPADADRVVANHMRALMATQPVDVGSSDRHTVKPWFNGRIPEAPRVVDLAGAG